MDYRRWTFWAEWTLVAVVIGLNGLIFFWPEDALWSSFLLTSLREAELLSAILLVVGWAILGPGKLWIRLLVSPALIGMWFWRSITVMQPWEPTRAFAFTYFSAVVFPVVGLRVGGFKIVRPLAASQAEPRAQFSLFSLLLAMTAIAGVIGALEALRPTISAPNSWQYADMSNLILFPPYSVRNAEWVRQLVIVTTVVLASASGALAVLRPGAVWPRLAAVIALAPVAGLYLTHLAGGADGYFVPTAISLGGGLAAVAALCGASVVPLWLMGYRLQWAGRGKVAAVGHARMPSRLAERTIERAAVALLLIAGAFAVPVTRIANRARQGYVDPGRINGGVMSWFGIEPANDLQPPLSAFRQWVEFRDVNEFNGLIWLITRSIKVESNWSHPLSLQVGNGQYVHPQSDDVQPDPFAPAAISLGQQSAGDSQ
jgi:hypothetical protein